jgi:hypothetical protein
MALCATLGCASPAAADDWYQISGGICFDATAADSKLGTPQGLEDLYQGLGENIVTHQVQDGAGGTIIVLRITDSSGAPFLTTTFYPSMADCQSVLSYEKTK